MHMTKASEMLFVTNGDTYIVFDRLKGFLGKNILLGEFQLTSLEKEDLPVD